MAQTYHFTFIDAPLETVWGVIFNEAEQQGRIVTMREPDLFVIETDGLYSVYGFRQYPAMEGKMGLYLVLTHDRAAAAELAQATDLFRALESMPIDVDADVYDNAKTHLQEIKTAAQQTAKTPHPPARTANAPKPSSDPNKSGRPASPHQSFGKGVPVVQLRLVWVVYLFSLIGLVPSWGLFLAMSLLFLNWFGMGKPRQALGATVSGVLVWSVLTLVVQSLFSPPRLGLYTLLSIITFIQVFIAAGIIFWQVQRQKPAYTQSVERYGRPSGWAFGNIALTVAALVGGGIIGVSWTRVLNIAAVDIHNAMSGQTVYTNARLTLSYPSEWQIDMSEGAKCDENSDCLLTVGGQSGGIMVLQDNNHFNFLTSLEAVAQIQIDAITAEGNAQDATTTRLKIDGRDAIQYRYRYMITVGIKHVSMTATILHIRDQNDWIRFYMFTTSDSANLQDSIVESLHFLKYAN